jgi:myo-inositol-1(or 4)-monophosphatase
MTGERGGLLPHWRRETAEAVAAVEQAIAVARGGVTAEGVAHKTGREIVTAADIAIEDGLRERLAGRLGIAVIGEERGGEPPADGAPYWLADPICGTRNYASGIPFCCVNLALIEQDRVSAAVVGEVSTGQIWTAERGSGAWARAREGWRRLTAGRASGTLVIEEGRCSGARRELAAGGYAAAVLADRWELRSFGTSLALAYVATAQVAGYVVFCTTAVHTAAGVLLAREAGATVTDLDGEPWTIRSDSIVAGADPDLHRELLIIAG